MFFIVFSLIIATLEISLSYMAVDFLQKTYLFEFYQQATLSTVQIFAVKGVLTFVFWVFISFLLGEIFGNHISYFGTRKLTEMFRGTGGKDDEFLVRAEKEYVFTHVLPRFIALGVIIGIILSIVYFLELALVLVSGFLVGIIIVSSSRKAGNQEDKGFLDFYKKYYAFMQYHTIKANLHKIGKRYFLYGIFVASMIFFGTEIFRILPFSFQDSAIGLGLFIFALSFLYVFQHERHQYEFDYLSQDEEFQKYIEKYGNIDFTPQETVKLIFYKVIFICGFLFGNLGVIFYAWQDVYVLGLLLAVYNVFLFAFAFRTKVITKE